MPGPSPLNAWSASVVAGARMEEAFRASLAERLGITIVKNNAADVRASDFRLECEVDVKYLQSPYPSDPTPANLSPATHLTLDVANITKYSPSTIIFMVVDYTERGVDTKGVYFVTAGRVAEIMESMPERVYRRSSRTHKDKIVKVGISVNETLTFAFPGMTTAQTVDAIRGAA